MITIAGEYRALHRDRGAARQKELFDRHQALVKKRDELTAEQRGFLLGSGSALAEYYKELANHEAVRRSRARLLITLNKAIHGYVRGARSRNRKRPGRRFLASLLLGQAVSWRFAELTHENLSIECHGANDHGFVLSGAEMTPGINTLLTADRDG